MRSVYQAHPVAVDAYARHRIPRRSRVWHVVTAAVQVVVMALALFAFYVAIVVLGPAVAA